MQATLPPASTVFGLISQPIVAEGLARLLDSCPDLHFAGYGTDPRQVTRDIARLNPQLFLLDHAYGMRVVFQMLAWIRQSAPAVRTVLWARDLNHSDRRLLLEAGLITILDKTLPVDATIECLRAVARGATWNHDSETTEDPDQHHQARRLTQREREIVALVKAGLKNREIGERLAITPGTVKVHLMHIFEKTGARDRFELGLQASRLLEMAGREERA